MKYKKHQQNKKIRRSKVLVALVALVITVAGTFLYFRQDGSTPDDEARTTSTTPTAQEDFNDGDQREPGNSLREDRGTGGIMDSGGSISESTDRSNPIVSSSGEITLFTPKANDIVSSSYQIAGTSTLSSVNYRVIDNVSGVIAMGELSVIDGNFSGKLNFTTSADQGRLDIFGTRNDGVEFDNIEVPLRFR